MKNLTKKEWDKTPDNKKSRVDKQFYILNFSEKIGTHLEPVKIVDDVIKSTYEKRPAELTLEEWKVILPHRKQINPETGKKWWLKSGNKITGGHWQEVIIIKFD